MGDRVAYGDPRQAWIINRIDDGAGMSLIVTPPPGHVWSRATRDMVRRALAAENTEARVIVILSEAVDATVLFP